MAGRGVAAAGNVLYLSLPGTTGNYASTPDSVAASITGSIDLRIDAALADWSPAAAAPGLISKMTGAGVRSYQLIMQTTGKPFFRTSDDGSDAGLQGTESNVAVGFANGARGWVRATFDSATLTRTYYTSTDGVAWTQLGTTAVLGDSAIFDSTSDVKVGATATGAGQNLSGAVYRVEIRDGIGGPIVALFDPTTVTKLGTRNPSSFVSSTGETWTINGSAWDWVT